MKYSVSFSSLDEFYKESDTIEPTGELYRWEEVQNNNESFVGLSKELINKSKYSYSKGLELLKELDLDINLGGSRKKYKWDDQDGDELSTERLNDGLPFLSKRLKTNGDSTGKFVNLYINVGENACIDYKSMLNKSYTAIQIIDYLENSGYKVGVIAFCDVSSLGYYKNEKVELLHTEIILKKPEDPLIKPLLLTCISPWMLRFHMFKFWTAKFSCSWGLGHSEKLTYKDDKNNLYINTGDCLNKKSAEERITYFKSIFEIKNEE